MGNLWQDLRYGFRMLRRNPGFTAVAVISLSLGIGANTAIFSLINTVLLKTLPVKDPQQLVFLHRVRPGGGTGDSFPYRTFEQLRDQNQTFSGMFAFDDAPVSASADGQAEMIRGEFVSGNYYSVLGAHAILGRTFTGDDDQEGKPPIAVISYGYWQRRFSLDPSVVGKSINLKGIPFTIIGVMPPDFFDRRVVGPGPDISVPLVMQPRFALKDHDTFEIMARLKPGVAEQQARADLDMIYRQALTEAAGPALSSQTRQEILAQRIELVPGSRGESDLRRQLSYPLGILMAVVGLVLLIACANVANLLLARTTARRREIAVRLAIGAGRPRLIRQLLTESILLAVLGGLLGLLFAWWGADLLSALLFNESTPGALDLQLDWRVFGFTGAVSLLTGVLFGLAPALRATRVDLSHTLKDNAAGIRGAGRRLGLGKALVILQVALSLLLLIGAGLLIRSFQKLNKVETGFNRENVLLFWVFPTLAGYEGPREISLYQQLLERINAIPGVGSASLSRLRLFSGGHWERNVRIQGQTLGPDEYGEVSFNAIGPRFFKTMGIGLLAGRDFTPADGENAPKVALISEGMARQFFKGVNPIGKRIGFAGEQSSGETEIIGVVNDIKSLSLREEGLQKTVYIPYTQAPPVMRGQMTFEVRTAGDPTPIAAAVRHEVQAIEKDLPLVGVQTQAEQVAQSLGKERSLATLSSLIQPARAAAGVGRSVRHSVVYGRAADERNRHSDGPRRAARQHTLDGDAGNGVTGAVRHCYWLTRRAGRRAVDLQSTLRTDGDRPGNDLADDVADARRSSICRISSGQKGITGGPDGRAQI